MWTEFASVLLFCPWLQTWVGQRGFRELFNQLFYGDMCLLSWLGERFGGKTVMGWGMLFFSASSMLLPLFAITPLTQSLGIVFPAVLLSRFLVGLGEGVALPSANNLMARNISLAKRASAFGGMFTGFHSGNLVCLLASPILLEMYGWRSVFYVFGVL